MFQAPDWSRQRFGFEIRGLRQRGHRVDEGLIQERLTRVPPCYACCAVCVCDARLVPVLVCLVLSVYLTPKIQCKRLAQNCRQLTVSTAGRNLYPLFLAHGARGKMARLEG